MPIYEVYITTTGREIYHVEADNEAQAEFEWHEGKMILSEVDDAWVADIMELE